MSNSESMKKYTQFGTLSVIVLTVAMFFCLVMFFIAGKDDPAVTIIMGFVILTFVICLLIFYKLTITIDDTYLKFVMGIGLIRKKYLLSDIESCNPVRNSALYGVGIRMIPSGWLFNVTGLYAIELTFKNRKTKIRIGTDKPDELAQMVSQKIDSRMAGSSYEKKGGAGGFLIIAILALAFFVPVILFFTGIRETEVTFSDAAMTIGGMYGLAAGYSEIVQVDTLLTLPDIKARTNGIAGGKVLKGNFKLSDQSKVKMFIVEDMPPYISIKTTATTIYLNFNNPAKTRDIYHTLLTKKASEQ
jgi:hypothetical protein